jgi:hypothetical protein
VVRRFAELASLSVHGADIDLLGFEHWCELLRCRPCISAFDLHVKFGHLPHMIENLLTAIASELPALKCLTLTSTNGVSSDVLTRRRIEQLLQACTALQYLSLQGDTLSLDVFSAGAELQTLHLSGARIVPSTVLQLLQVRLLY